MTKQRLTIGTRASPLALAQAQQIRQHILALPVFADWDIELVPISTRGDRILDRPLAEIGGKGLFTAELDHGLAHGEIDIAVHSLKDLPTAQDDELVIAAIPVRASPLDCLITQPSAPQAVKRIADLPPAARVGTASLRRKAQLLRLRPDLEIVSLRGNVGTRLEKIEREGLAATILAQAGLQRLSMDGAHIAPLECEDMVPAAGQGALAVQVHSRRSDLVAALAPIHDQHTADCVTAERTFLEALEGNCRTPIAAYAEIVNGQLRLHGRVLSEDGADCVELKTLGPPREAALLGADTAAQIKQLAPQLIPEGA